VSLTAPRDAHNGIIGYLLIGSDNTARKKIEEKQEKFDRSTSDRVIRNS